MRILMAFLFGTFLGFSQTKLMDTRTFLYGIGVSVLAGETTFQIKDKIGLSCGVAIGAGFAYSGLRAVADKKFDYVTSGWGNIIGTIGVACSIDFRKRERQKIKDAYSKR